MNNRIPNQWRITESGQNELGLTKVPNFFSRVKLNFVMSLNDILKFTRPDQEEEPA